MFTQTKADLLSLANGICETTGVHIVTPCLNQHGAGLYLKSYKEKHLANLGCQLDTLGEGTSAEEVPSSDCSVGHFLDS